MMAPQPLNIGADKFFGLFELTALATMVPAAIINCNRTLTQTTAAQKTIRSMRSSSVWGRASFQRVLRYREI
jgi:hypothetical protein